jgi:hypothetical protein
MNKHTKIKTKAATRTEEGSKNKLFFLCLGVLLPSKRYQVLSGCACGVHHASKKKKGVLTGIKVR